MHAVRLARTILNFVPRFTGRNCRRTSTDHAPEPVLLCIVARYRRCYLRGYERPVDPCSTLAPRLLLEGRLLQRRGKLCRHQHARRKVALLLASINSSCAPRRLLRRSIRTSTTARHLLHFAFFTRGLPPFSVIPLLTPIWLLVVYPIIPSITLSKRIAMAPEIRVNSTGIPYIVEFANVSFRSHSQKSVPQTRPVLRSAATTIPKFVPSASVHSGPAVDERSATPSTLGTSPSKQARGPQRSLLRTLSLPFHAVQLRLPRRLRRKTSVDSDWTLAGFSAASSQETLAAPPPPPKDEFYIHPSSVRGSQSSYDTPSQYSQDSGVDVDTRKCSMSNAKGEGLLIRPTFSAAGVYPRGHPYRRLKP